MLRSSKRLLQAPELNFNSPTPTIKLTGLAIGQPLWVQDIGDEVHVIVASILEVQQPKHQRRLAFFHGGIGPAINNPVRFSNVAQLLQQTDVAANAHQEVMVLRDRTPKVVADKPRITAKQRVFGELLCLEHFQHMLSFTGVGRPCVPAPRHPLPQMPDHGQPHLRSDRLRIVMLLLMRRSSLACGRAATLLLRLRFSLALLLGLTKLAFVSAACAGHSHAIRLPPAPAKGRLENSFRRIVASSFAYETARSEGTDANSFSTR